MPLSTRELIAVAERRDEEAKAAFSKYDVDGSGKIDHTDILCVLDDLGLVKKLKSGATNFVADYNASLGPQNDTRLSYAEFRSVYNAAIDNINGNSKLNRKPSAKDKKLAAMAKACMDARKSDAHPLFPDCKPASNDVIGDLATKLKKFLTSRGIKEQELGKLMGAIERHKLGKIGYDELREFVHAGEPKGLGISEDAMPDNVVQSMWVALDERKGFISQSKLGWLISLVHIGDDAEQLHDRAEGKSEKSENEAVVPEET